MTRQLLLRRGGSTRRSSGAGSGTGTKHRAGSDAGRGGGFDSATTEGGREGSGAATGGQRRLPGERRLEREEVWFELYSSFLYES